MKTTGQILKQTRTKKNLEIDQVAKVTKIRPVYLKALEEDDYQKLPSVTSARGFIKNYAEFLGLSSAELLAIFRRDFDEKKAGKMDPLRKMELAGPKFIWTPKLTTAVVVVIFALLFIAYLVWQYFSLVSAPYY